MKNVQAYIREKGLDALKSEFHIDVKRSEKYPDLVLLKYDQISSPMGNPIVQECRGLILDSHMDFAPVAWPFHKFFNHGEGNAASINWDKARVQEKLDGSLITLYHYDGCWNAATSGNPDAAGQVNDFPFTFGQLFWETFSQKGLPLDMLEEDCTYMFELTTPFNRVVVPHSEPNVRLIGVRHLPSGEEDATYHYPELNPVKEFGLSSIDEVLESFHRFEGLRQEGYVIVDDAFNRIKVKHPGYVALHHMKDSLGSSRKSLVKLVVANEGDEFLSYFPEYRPMYEEISQRYHSLIDGLDDQYVDILVSTDNRKDFAAKAVKTRIPGFMFAKLDAKVDNVAQYVANQNIDGVMKMLGYKE